MKCVQCGTDTKKKDRPAGTCPKCAHPFTFDPTNGDELTDAAFAAALTRVGAQGKVRFTEAHLVQELRRVGARRRRGCNAFFSAFEGLFRALGLVWGPNAATEGGPLNDPARLHVYIMRWLKFNGPLPGLIQSRPQPAGLSAEMLEELRSYSFDRAVITDQREIVDTLVANRFHFENNCAVLTAGGYPRHSFDVLRDMLRRNPNILVLVVHDATPDGCRLAHTLRHSPEWFKGIGRVVDVGLRPAHARFFPGLEQPPRQPGPVTPGGGILPAEAEWLALNRLDLTVIRPEQLVKRLYRAIVETESRDSGSGSSGGDEVLIYGGNNALLGTDADTSDGGADSFG